MNNSPDQTIAVVVGIETYDRAVDPDGLDGPVPDACRFIDWLLGRGVPPDNITLLAAPLDKNAALVEKKRRLGVWTRSATAESIRERLVTELPRQQSSLLLLFWGGHGLVDGDQRRLVYSDATRPDLRNLNITDFLKCLRSTTYRNHPQQQIIIDACSNFVKPQSRSDPEKMPDERFNSGIPVEIDQRAYFAASDGEKAVNSNARRTGYFSEAVQGALADLPQEDWPPNLDIVRDAVNAKFDGMRTAGKVRQSPTDIWFKSRSSEYESLVFSTDFGFDHGIAAAAGAALLDDSEYRLLNKILRGSACPENLMPIFRESTRAIGVPAPSTAEDLRAVIDCLRLPLSAEPMFEFLVRYASATDTVTAARLWDFVRETGRRYRVDVDRLQDLSEKLNRVHVLVRVQPDILSACHLVHIWRFFGTDCASLEFSAEPWNEGDIGRPVASVLSGIDPEFPPVVEFQVPNELLDFQFELISVEYEGEPTAIGSLCPVVVRPLQRGEKVCWLDAHEQVWTAVGKYDAYDKDAIWWMDRVPAAEKSGGGSVCAALTFTCEGPRGAAAMPYLLDAGTPIALWHRVDRPTGKSALGKVLRGHSINELPDVIHEQRRNLSRGDATADHPARSVVLLWDDPGRSPGPHRWEAPLTDGGVANDA